MRERSDVRRNRAAILRAAEGMLDDAADLEDVTMDDIADAAGVGKGTVFRRFGDRRGLLRAVFDTRIAALVDAVESGDAPLGPSTPPGERITALMRVIVQFKLSNQTLSRALEDADARAVRPRFQDTPSYLWGHRLLSRLLSDLGSADGAEFTAHALLSITRFDTVQQLDAETGHDRERLWQLLDDYVRRLVGPAPAGSPTAAASTSSASTGSLGIKRNEDL